MSKAFKCDYCGELREGEPERTPEQWLIRPIQHVELHDRGLNLSVEVRVDAPSAEICLDCQKEALRQAFRGLREVYEI